MKTARGLLVVCALAAAGCSSTAETASPATTAEPTVAPTTTTEAATTTTAAAEEPQRPTLAFAFPPAEGTPPDLFANGPVALTFSFDADPTTFDESGGYIEDGQPRHNFWRIDMDLDPDSDYSFVATGAEQTAGVTECSEWLQNSRGAFVRSPSLHGYPFSQDPNPIDWVAQAQSNYPVDADEVYQTIGLDELPPLDFADGSRKRTTALSEEQVTEARTLFPNPGGFGDVGYERAQLVSYAEESGLVTWLSLEAFVDGPEEGQYTRTLFLTASFAPLEETTDERSLMGNTPGCNVYFG